MEEWSIEDPTNIAGMHLLIDRSNTKSGFNPLELEQQIMNGASLSFKKQKPGGGGEYNREIDKLAESVGMAQTPARTIRDIPQTPKNNNDFEVDKLMRDLDELDSGFEGHHDEPKAHVYPGTPRVAPAYEEEYHPQTPRKPVFQVNDAHLEDMTIEERKQNVIGQVFNDMDDNQSSPILSIEKEKEEDEKARKLEQISFLMSALEEENEDLSRIPKVSHGNTRDEIDAVLKVLVLKNDRKRCCTFAEEAILLGAHGLEYAFDGQRTYFGFRPDLVDWHKSVAVKLRRMRADTSQVVSNVMQQYNLGPGTRLLLELLPNMVLYSRMRKAQHNDTIISDDLYNDSLNKIRDME